MADLSQLFQVAPGTASFFTGQQFAQDRAMNELRQRELADLIAQRQAQEARTGELHPFELEQRGLANQTSRAQLPGLEASSTLKQLDARKGQELYDMDVRVGKAKKSGELDDERIKNVQRVHGFLTDIGPELEQTPPALRTQHFRARVEQAGFDPSNPQVQRTMQMVAQNPDKAPALLRQLSTRLGEQITERSSTYQTEAMKRDSAEKVARGNNKTQVDVANIYAGARKGGGKAQDALEKALVSGKWDQAATAYDHLAQEAARKGDQEEAAYYQQKSKEYSDKFLRSRSGGSPKAGGLNLGEVSDLPTNPAPSTEAPALPPGKAAAPKAAQKLPTMVDIQKMYPGVPPDKLKEAFKKKFGVDLQ